MFNYAKDHQPCIIFMDEIDAIGKLISVIYSYLFSLKEVRYYIIRICNAGGKRFSEGTSADREIQRTLMELLNQMDGFDSLGQVCLLWKFFIILIIVAPKLLSLFRKKGALKSFLVGIRELKM